MDKELSHVLNESGKTSEVVGLDNGSEVLLLPYGGRILGLFAAGDSRNFYWTNPALKSASEARSFFQSDTWQNTGGDRTWLAPEIDFFFPNFPDRSVYRQPREFDAHDYRVDRIQGVPVLTTEFDIKPSRHPLPIRLRLTKAVESVANPLRHEAAWKKLSGVTFAGYGLRTTLEFAGTPCWPVGLWHLIQMPQGGKMLLPTYGLAEPVVVFGNIPTADLEHTRGGIRYSMRAAGEQKIALRAVSCTGRVAYYHESEETAQLVLRNFYVNPSGEYVDAPWTDPTDLSYCVQACHVDSHLGAFSELEYHNPAIGVPGAPAKSEDFAQVWAYRGTRSQITQIAQLLLGITVGGNR